MNGQQDMALVTKRKGKSSLNNIETGISISGIPILVIGTLFRGYFANLNPNTSDLMIVTDIPKFR
jgi:hypothetical protein